MGYKFCPSVKNLRIWYINLWKKFGCDMHVMWRAIAKTCWMAFRGANRQSPFAYRKSAKYDPKMSRRTYSNFWTNRDTEDCNHSKWPELPQGFKFLIKNCFCLTWAECCPIYCCPRPYSVGPEALSPTQILSPSFGMKFSYPKPMFLRVGQVIWRHSARATVHHLHKKKSFLTFFIFYL